MSRQLNGIDLNGELLEIIPPVPTEDVRGGIKAKPKGSNDTVEIKIGEDDKLYAPSYPTSLPASDVPSWAKQTSKPTYTAAEVGADSKGTASSTVSTHNTALDAHNDIRLLISNLTTIINTILNSEDVDLDQLSEIVAYIKSNRSLIEQITTNKINVSDIIDNLTTNVANKPLSAKQGVALKALIDAIKVPTKLSELSADATHRLVTDTEKSAWNAKSDFSGSYNDLTNKPTIPSKTSQLSNDSGYIKKAPVEVAVQSGIPSEGALWVDTDGEGEIILAEIDDTTYSGEKTWSSNKIKSEMTGLNEKIVQQGVRVTPQMYGAVGDGVTDDTQAFKDALAENDNVFVPEGNYLITEPIDLSNKKTMVSDDNQGATIIYDGTDSVILVGRKTIFRNINITLNKAFTGIVFNTNNYNKVSSTFGLESKVEHSHVQFNQKSTEATVIGITVDSGTDANNMPKLTGICYQNYRDITVGGSSYGYGIKMELIQGRAFTEETKTGFPWLTHVNFNDINLGSPYCGIKATVTNTSGSEYFNRINTGHILFNNVFTQNAGIENTRYFLDVDHFSGYFTKCIGWDYHHTTQDYGEKVNIIGEGAELSFSDCEMHFGVDLLESCDFTAEKDSAFTVESSPAYFINKYFNGTFLRNGYDSVDAKVDAKLDKAYIKGISEEVMNDVLYSGYSNVLDDPLTQIKIGLRFSNSEQSWKRSDNQTTVVIPIIVGGNIIRWQSSKYRLSVGDYESLFYFNDDELTSGTYAGQIKELDYLDGNNGYIVVDNPNGYKYVSIPFLYCEDISSETMTMTINREITGNEGKSYTEYLRDSVIVPAVEEKVGELKIPTKTSQLTNDSGFLTEHQSLDGYAKTKDHYTKTETDNKFQPKGDYLTEHQDISGKADKSSAETWTFTLADGSTVTKKVVLA